MQRIKRVRPTQHVVSFSGGVGSWATAKIVREHIMSGNDRLVLLFADTLIEDADLYRFLDEAADDVGGQLIRISDGRTPWQVFRDVRFLGNSRIDPCSRVLKRELMRSFLDSNYDPVDTVVYIGIDWTEDHRYIKAQKYWSPWTTRAPLCEDAHAIDKDHQLTWLASTGIETPLLYRLGFPHNNCGGGCVKAGMAHFALLLEKLPERYAWWETNEQDMRDFLGANVSILTDRAGGDRKPLTLQQFRRRLEGGGDYDRDEWGGCACFTPDVYDEGEVPVGN